MTNARRASADDTTLDRGEASTSMLTSIWPRATRKMMLVIRQPPPSGPLSAHWQVDTDGALTCCWTTD